ncbi:MAG: Uma2 family endonuclease [Chloroflexota bacterium]
MSVLEKIEQEVKYPMTDSLSNYKESKKSTHNTSKSHGAMRPKIDIAKSLISYNKVNSNGANKNGETPVDTKSVESAWDYHPDYPYLEKGISPDDPYRYGWRYVKRTTIDGSTVSELQPLTREDFLCPEEDDNKVQNYKHKKNGLYLDTACDRQLTHMPNRIILQDTRVDWSTPGVSPFDPDVTVILDGHLDPLDKGTYVSGEDGDLPIMVVEITSPSTWDHDFDRKPWLLQQVEVPYYFVVNTIKRAGNLGAYGYELTPEGYYIGTRPNDDGWVWMEPVQLWLTLEGDDVRCYDIDRNLILAYVDLAESEAEQRKRADEANERADAAARRAEEEARRAEEEARRAEEEARRAAEAEARAQTADAENQRLLAYLRSLGVDPSAIPTGE